MRDSWSMFIVVCVLEGTRVAAPAAELPAAVAKDLRATADQCRETGGKPDTSRAVTAVDLTGDGKDDFVFHVGGIVCGGFASLYGDREKGVTVYVGDGAGGATKAFDDMVFDAKIERVGSTATLWLTVSGRQCGKPPAVDFAHENFCERPLVWNAAKKTLEYAPVAKVRMIR